MSVPRNLAPLQQSSLCAGSQDTVGMRTNSRSARSISLEMRAEICNHRKSPVSSSIRKLRASIASHDHISGLKARCMRRGGYLASSYGRCAWGGLPCWACFAATSQLLPFASACKQQVRLKFAATCSVLLKSGLDMQ